MKGFIAIILFFVLALAGVKTGHLSVASSIAVPGQCAVQDDCFTHSHSVNEGAIIPLERERYLADMEFSDAQDPGALRARRPTAPSCRRLHGRRRSRRRGTTPM